MNNKFKSIIAFGGFIIFVIIIGGGISGESEIIISESEEINIEDISQTMSGDIEQNLICVYIIGAVKNPGVILVPEGTRLYRALESVGGASKDADINLINLAEIVNDGEKIIIPFKEKIENKMVEQKANEINRLYDSAKNNELGKININTATKEELKTLSGIGDSTAEKIIEYRNNLGKFKSIEDLKNVSRYW